MTDFDDGNWGQGTAGFGVPDHVTPPTTVGTTWSTSEIWLRKTIDVPVSQEFASAAMIVRHDENVEVLVNGNVVFSAEGFNTEWAPYDVTQELRATLKPGKNLVAVHVAQTGGGQYIDVGLVLDPQQKLIVPVKPMDPAEWQRLCEARWSEAKAWEWYAKKLPTNMECA